MRWLFPILLVCGLLALAALPIGYAQPGLSRTAAYLPAVFRAAETPTRLATITPTTGVIIATATRTATSSPVATPTATSGTSDGFPPVGPGTPTRTPVPADRPIFTNGQDLWNCSHFDTWEDANFVFQANQPGDPNKLDQNNDGIPCEALIGR